MSNADKSNEMTGAEALVHLLEEHGVDTIFGLCGDTTLPWYDALARLNHNINHILTRDERHAAYMADGYARVTGKIGICEGPSGGGATYMVPGVVEANESSVPILAITTDVATTSRGKFPLTELDQKALFRPLTKSNDMLDESKDLPSQIRDIFKALSSRKPGAGHLGLPFDTQKGNVSPDDVWGEEEFGSFPASRQAPDKAAVNEAARLLLAAENPIVICGGGLVISGAEPELAELAHRLDLAVATTVSGQGSMAETDPNCLGVVGSNGGVEETRKFVEDADLVFFIGCRAGSVTTERWRYPATGTTIIHLDADPKVPGAIYETAASLVGDAKLGLEAINRELKDQPAWNKGTKSKIAAALEDKYKIFNKLASSSQTPIKPERVVSDLQSILDDDAIICADPGTPCPYFSGYYQWPKAGRHFITNRAHGALGYALAASMGAQVGRPESQVLAIMGDGSFAFCCGEFETLVRYNIPVTILVFSNATFGWIKAGQDSGFDKRYYNVDFTRTDHAAVANAYGIKSWTVENPNDLKASLQQALAVEGPSLVDIISQPLHEANAPVSEWVA